jgi:aminomethyltransferase
MTSSAARVVLGAPVRDSPFQEATRRSGCRAYGVFNGLRVPVSFESPEADYWRRVHACTIRDASSDVHVEISGPDAAVFVQWLVATRLDDLAPGHCRVALLADEQGAVVGYPMILRLAAERYWLAQDSPDLLPWVKGAALHAELDFQVGAPQVATLALEGSRAPQALGALLDVDAPGLGKDEVRRVQIEDIPLLVSPRAGAGVPAYSLRLQEMEHATALWRHLLGMGAGLDMAPSAQCAVLPVEAGLPSFAFDMDGASDPFEMGLGDLVDLAGQGDFVGKTALTAMHARGPRRRLMGAVIDGEPLAEPNPQWWPLMADGEVVGDVRTAVFSPRLGENVALALVLLAYAEPGVRLEASSPRGPHHCVLKELPFLA